MSMLNDVNVIVLGVKHHGQHVPASKLGKYKYVHRN